MLAYTQCVVLHTLRNFGVRQLTFTCTWNLTSEKSNFVQDMNMHCILCILCNAYYACSLGTWNQQREISNQLHIFVFFIICDRAPHNMSFLFFHQNKFFPGRWLNTIGKLRGNNLFWYIITCLPKPMFQTKNEINSIMWDLAGSMMWKMSGELLW